MTKHYTDVDQATSFSHGFDAGNYAAAYTGTDWESWWAEKSVPDSDETPEQAKAYAEGAILGFHSSLEIDEISDDSIAEEISSLRAKHGGGCMSTPYSETLEHLTDAEVALDAVGDLTAELQRVKAQVAKLSDDKWTLLKENNRLIGMLTPQQRRDEAKRIRGES